MTNITISIAADHAGFETKEKIKHWLVEKGYTVNDFGTSSTDSVDYPDFGSLVANSLSSNNSKFGVLVCGSGIGMCMVANRYPGVRAVVIRSKEDAELSRQHNNANVACFGSRITNEKEIIFLLDVFLNKEFEGGRHNKRVSKIDSKE